MTNEIELKRKELEDDIKYWRNPKNYKKIKHQNQDSNFEIAIRLHKLEGFNLGVEMGKAEGKQEAHKAYNQQLKLLIYDIEKHWNKVVSPKDNIIISLNELIKTNGKTTLSKEGEKHE